MLFFTNTSLSYFNTDTIMYIREKSLFHDKLFTVKFNINKRQPFWMMLGEYSILIMKRQFKLFVLSWKFPLSKTTVFITN